MNAEMPKSDVPKLLEICSGVWVRQEIDNIAWVDMGEYVIVIDALENRGDSKSVHEMLLQTIGDKPVRYVLNTHTHHDHMALNKWFEKEYGAEIINFANKAIDPDGLHFEGTRRLVMRHFPGCHTRDDCIIHLPDDRILFVGDIFGWGLIPWDGHFDESIRLHLIHSYDCLIGLNAKHVVPGHGPLLTTGELRRWLDYFNWVVRAVKEAVNNGHSEEDLCRNLEAPVDMKNWWRFMKWKHKDTLLKVMYAVRHKRL